MTNVNSLDRQNSMERFFLKRMDIQPMKNSSEEIVSLIEMAKKILADAVVEYVTNGSGFNQSFQFQETSNAASFIMIEPDTEGACVTQIANTFLSDYKKDTRINFYALRDAYLANVDDSNLLDQPISKKKCSSGYHKYSDKILLTPLKDTFIPFVNIAKSIIAGAAAHFSWTGENIIANTCFYRSESNPSSHTIHLHLLKLEYGVRVEQYINWEHIGKIVSGNDNVEFDFRKLKQLSIISNERFSQKMIAQIRAQIDIPDIRFMDFIANKAKDIITQAALHYCRTKEQALPVAIELWGENATNNYIAIGKMEIVSDEDGVQVTQFYSENKKIDRKDFSINRIEFSLLKEAS